MIFRPKLEHLLVDHCNLRCSGCSVHSPFLDERFSDLDMFKNDIEALSKVMKVQLFRFIGGEPTLHPQLSEFVKVAKESGIAKIISICTNGTNLHKLSDEVFLNIDILDISVYTETKINYKKQAEFIQEKLSQIYQKYNHRVILNPSVLDEVFLDLHSDDPFDENTTQQVYNACENKEFCHSFRDGKFYQCDVITNKNQYLKNIGKPVDIDFAIEDTIDIHSDKLDTRLVKYINSRTPLKACYYCRGTSAQLVPRVQHTVKEIKLIRSKVDISTLEHLTTTNEATNE